MNKLSRELKKVFINNSIMFNEDRHELNIEGQVFVYEVGGWIYIENKYTTFKNGVLISTQTKDDDLTNQEFKELEKYLSMLELSASLSVKAAAAPTKKMKI